MSLRDRLSNFISSTKTTVEHKIANERFRSAELKNARDQRNSEERHVSDTIKRFGLTRDRENPGRIWLSNTQYVDVDPGHPGTARRIEQLASRVKSDIKVHSVKPSKGRAAIKTGSQPPASRAFNAEALVGSGSLFGGGGPAMQKARGKKSKPSRSFLDDHPF